MWRGYESDQSEQSGRDARRDSLVAKWKEQSGQLKSTGTEAYLLFLTGWDHGKKWYEEPEIVGIFDSKAAAVARASTVECDYGTFDEAIKDYGCKEDNREDPPDDGILIQIGDHDIGEGDICRLSIKKLPLLGIQGAEVKKEAGAKKEAEATKEKDVKDSGTKKRKHTCSSSSDESNTVYL